MRERKANSLKGAGDRALDGFANFLRSPGIKALLRTITDKTSGLHEILEAKSDKEISEVLMTLSSKDRKVLARCFKAVLGHKKQKLVPLSNFAPQSTTILEKKEIENAVNEFSKYLNDQWEEGRYLKLEK